MPRNRILSYNSSLKYLARQLRQNSTLTEIILWKNLKGKALGYEFHRQVPIGEFIVDFYCHELQLVIEIDGYTHDYNFVNDLNRQKYLESLGIMVIRFTDEDIKKCLNDVLKSIEVVILEIETNREML
jgi:very-short-patch-repair endonuclease